MDLPDNLGRTVIEFIQNFGFIILLVIISVARRNRKSKGPVTPAVPTNTPSRAESKQRAYSLFPPDSGGSVITTPTSVTTVTPPPVTEERPNDLMKDLVKRV